MGYVTLFSNAAFGGNSTVFSVSRGGETAGSVARNHGASGFGGETAGSVASSSFGSSCGSSSGGCSFSAIA